MRSLSCHIVSLSKHRRPDGVTSLRESVREGHTFPDLRTTIVTIENRFIFVYIVTKRMARIPNRHLPPMAGGIPHDTNAFSVYLLARIVALLRLPSNRSRETVALPSDKSK